MKKTTIEKITILNIKNDEQLILDRTKKEYLIGKRKTTLPHPRGKGAIGSPPSYRIRFGQLELITTLS